LISQAEVLLPKIEDVKAEQMGDLVDQEMAETTSAIEKAAARIAVSNTYSVAQNLGTKMSLAIKNLRKLVLFIGYIVLASLEHVFMLAL